MKKLLLPVLFCTFISQAQIIAIPDVNFKAKLLAASTSVNIAADATGNNMKIDANNDGEIQVSEALQVIGLDISTSQIVSLVGVKSFTNLKKLGVAENLLTTLDVSGMANLESLNCFLNQLTSLNMEGSVHLKEVFCGMNPLHEMDFGNLPLLSTLHCESAQLTSVDVTGLPELAQFMCFSNHLTTLDLSHNPKLEFLEFYGNSGIMTSLFIKNGHTETIGADYGAWDYAYICADEDQIPGFLQLMEGWSDGFNGTINSYCTFTPGGNFNTVTGHITYDTDNDGCDANDAALSLTRMNVNDGVNNFSVTTNESGNYLFYSQAGNFTFSPALENPSAFNVNMSGPMIAFANNNNNAINQDVCISPVGSYRDVEVIIVPVTAARPGFNATYKIIFKNKGNQAASGNISFTYDDGIFDFLNASVAPSSQNTGSLSWNYSGLQPFESKFIEVEMNLNGPMETPPVNINDGLVFNAAISIDSAAGDQYMKDNSFVFTQTVIGSWDPNDITCLEGAAVSPTEIGKYLHYNINFENTGTAAAENIVVKDMIDLSKFDLSSLQVMGSSHPVTARVTGNKVEFIFEGINLGAGAHGNVTFKIKTKTTLVTGNSVANKADIYFDYNFPVATNEASTTFQVLGTGDFELGNSVSIYPNPVKSSLNVKSGSAIKSVEFFDLQGRLLEAKQLNANEATLDISAKAKGIYLVKVTSSKGSTTQKIIRE